MNWYLLGSAGSLWFVQLLRTARVFCYKESGEPLALAIFDFLMILFLYIALVAFKAGLS